ncbi:MAG: hypothetical protein AB7F86_20080 [Bdellovibrionales bacterium]
MRARIVYICLTILVSLSFGQAFADAKIKKSARTKSNSRLQTEAQSLNKWELRTAPIAMLASWYTLDVSFHLTPYFSMGPAVVLYNDRSEHGGMLAPTYHGHALGWHGYYYFRSHARHGMYLGLRSYYESYRSRQHGLSGQYEDRDGFRTDLFTGYRMRWSRFTMMAGGGLEIATHSVVEREDALGSRPASRKTYNETRSGPMIEFKLGLEI